MLTVSQALAQTDRTRVVMNETYQEIFGECRPDIDQADLLRDAIKHNKLCVQYQPRYDVDTQHVKIVEALVRWRKDDGCLTPPDDFIGLAIRHELIFDLDLWVFNRCCEDLIWLRQRHEGEIKISVNITAVECENRSHTEKLVNICQAHGLKLSDFEFEITESVSIYNAKKMQDFCRDFVEKGAHISLDDFGTGQSPLSSLCNFSIDTIKIDRSFVQQMMESESRARILINHLIAIAREMKMKIVAEGVETLAQFKKLKQLGCHQIQGFHISRPLSVNILLGFLGAQ